jgi:predicted alpha/beta-fold hydrolase
VDLFRGLQEALLPRDAPLLLILHGIVGARRAHVRLFLRFERALQAAWKVCLLKLAK